MRRVSTVSFSAVLLAGSVFAATTAGCTINPVSSDNADAGAAQAGSPNGEGDSDQPGASTPSDPSSPEAADGSTTQGDGKVSFKPSNVPVDQIDLSKAGDVAVNGQCRISSDKDEFSCGEGKASFTLFTQSDQSRVGMYVVKSFRVEANATLEVTGNLPIVIVALDKMEILGTVRVNAEGRSGAPGGFINDKRDAKGGGPGGGGAGSDSNGGGGASYCGVGGAGSAKANGSPGVAGKVYGNAEISPLVGGSAGGSTGESGGSGGGAIQLVSGGTFLLSATGVVHAGGGGGLSDSEASGGGSGGAILIEAESATILGTLAANGGGGGAGWGSSGGPLGEEGKNATPDDAVASGGVISNAASKGGAGAAADVINGSAGTHSGTGYPAGGGGGAGRIRINTRSGAATLTSATISPSANTTCFTQGKLTN